MGSVPGMAALEPAWEEEVRAALEWAMAEAEGPVYVRLVTPPWELPFDPPAGSRLERGRGTVVREGGEGAFVCAGPVLVSQAWLAAAELGFAVVALPWLRGIDGEWLAATVPEGPIVCLDNHVLPGGQGQAVLAAVPPEAAPRVVLHGIDGIPACGSNEEVLAFHRLDAAGLAALVREREAVPA
jgi:transketolase